MTVLVPVCLYRTTPSLLVALDDVFGEPTDSYVNGSQVWLRPDGPRPEGPGPDNVVIEWRLHPVAHYRRPAGTTPYDVFGTTALALARGEAPPAPPERLWDGLEAFPAYGDEVEPATLANACEAALGVRPDLAGLVDHESIAAAWEQAGGGLSIVDALIAQLTPT